MTKRTKTPPPGKDAPRARVSAKDAIASAQHRHKVAPLKAGALKALQEILAHNDVQTNHMRRVGWRAACEVLQSHEWNGATIHALDRACREQLARSSYSTP